MAFKDLTGYRNGTLLVTSFSHKEEIGKRARIFFNCYCDPVFGGCGEEKKIWATSIKKPEVKSCGCLKRSKRVTKKADVKTTKKAVLKTKTKSLIALYKITYQKWAAMIQRCTNPNNPGYKHYGARGISVCERWLIFENFLVDMGEVPKGLTLERVNNNGNYEPSNVIWATNLAQQNNRRTNRFIEYLGETKTLQQWCRLYNMKYPTVWVRLNKGWSIHDALTKPLTQGKSQD